MASCKLAQASMSNQLKGAIARRCFTSIGSGIIGLRSPRYVSGTSISYQRRIPGWSKCPWQFIHRSTVLSRVATVQSTPWTRCYSMHHDPLDDTESIEETQSIIREIDPLVRDVNTLRDEAEKAERPINGPGQTLDGRVGYAYACLRDLADAVVKAVCTGTLGKGHGEESVYYVIKSFRDALDINEKAAKKLGQLQEQCTDYAGKISSLVSRLGAAERFLVDQVKKEKDLLELATEQLFKTRNDLEEVKHEIYLLEREIEIKRKLQAVSVFVPVVGPYIILGLEYDLKAKVAKRTVFEEQLDGLKKTMKVHFDKAEEIDFSIKNLTLLSGQLLSGQKLLQNVSNSNRNVRDAVLQAKHSLVETYNHLADMNASARVGFESSLCLSYCQTILRVVLSMPNVTVPERQDDELQRIVISDDICKSIEKLPQGLLTEEEDPLDYGNEEKSLGELLKEARAFLRLRLTAFEQNISGNAKAVLNNCGYEQEDWLALKRSIMDRD
ncbi:hypothetical protein PENFLA_c023G03131 [Penicillium flavigenum]|uniref:Uncharacterized protein n=1 Tax=Penicillium flavigenum TaxID=254877 RepID=A0A1V6SUW9_9EURO|nr:hypothetical protein PENFLA_c023G03131 [Penicillium flavigenum]